MPNTHAECLFCGAELPPPQHWRQKKRLYCNDNCRSKDGYFRRQGGPVTNIQRAERLYGKCELPQWQEWEKSWLAAFVDAEGWIGLTVHKQKGRTSPGFPMPQIGIANNSIPVITRIQELLGTRWTMLHDSHKTEIGFRQVRSVRIKRQAMLPFLEAIRPYLIGKTEQADLVMAFLRRHNDLPVRTRPLPEFFETMALMAKLNKRGRRD